MIQIIREKSGMNWIALCLVFVLISGLFPWQIYAQESIGISKQVIIVKNEKGESIKDAVFEIQNEKKEILETCISDENGRAEIINVDDGNYQLIQTKTQEGYEVIKERTIEIKTENPIREEIIVNKYVIEETGKTTEIEEEPTKIDQEVIPEENGLENNEQELDINNQKEIVIDDNKAKEEVTSLNVEDNLTTAVIVKDTTVSITQNPGNATQYNISTVGCAGKTGVSRVIFPTWTNKNGQDDIQWIEGQLGSNGEYGATIDIKDHGFETGEYITHTYIYGLKGETLAFYQNIQEQKTPSPTIEVDENVINNSYKIRLKGASNPEGVTAVSFPTWSKTNGQDDMNWVWANYIGNDTWEATVNLKDYKQTYDTFISHVYMTTKTGQMKMAGISEKTIESPVKDITVSITQNPENATQYNISTVGCAGKTGVSRVIFPTWTNKNGQDDIQWIEGRLGSNGEYGATIDIKDHGFETGEYITHTYIYGLKGETLAFYQNRQEQKTPSPTIEVDENVINNSYKIRLKGASNPEGVTAVSFPTWSKTNGQDDMNWVWANYIGNDTWEATVNLKDYKKSYDTFISHIYVSDKNQAFKYIGISEKNIENPFLKMPVEIVIKKDSNTSKFIVSTQNCNGQSGVNGISFPIWTDRNGQDDIRWYQGKLGTNGEYSAEVDIENHGFETGPYCIHAYLYGNGGENIAFSNSSYTMEKISPTIEYDNAVLNNIFKIRIKNVGNENGVSGMVFPTWSNSNGQDDIRWEQGTYIGNNTWEATINLRNYNIIVDDFITHVYLIDKNGKQVMAQNSVKHILQNTSTVYGDFDYPLNFNYQSNPNDPTDWFGPRWGSIHEGIDVPAPRYAKCYAVANGVIEKAGYFMGYGRYVRIRTTDRYGESVSFFYGHLQQINVSVGDTVTKGQVVGLVGGSGYDANGNYSDYAYGEHLHFGAIANADWECVDPEIWIDFHNPYSNVK